MSKSSKKSFDILSPFTRIPNVVFDFWQRKLTLAQFAVFLCIMRKTYGFGKESDEISITQFQESTGLSDRGIKDVLIDLIQKGLISKSRSTKINGSHIACFYTVNRKKIEIVHNSKTQELSSQVVHKTQELSSQDPRNSVPTQKTKKETILVKETLTESLFFINEQCLEQGKEAKKFRLNSEQKISYSWLIQQNINTSKDTLNFWARTYDLKRLQDVYLYAQSQKVTNIGGYMNKLLKHQSFVPLDVMRENSTFAIDYKNFNNWPDLRICTLVVECSIEGHMHEIPLNMDQSKFAFDLMEMHAKYDEKITIYEEN